MILSSATSTLRAAALLTLAPLAAAQIELGLGKMWAFENPPLEYLAEEYGFQPTPEWFDALRLASLRFGGGCSASFVSPEGLIMTNHHCVRGYIAEVSPEGEDWVKNGFYATSLEEEVRIPGLTVQQLVEMRDITEAMHAGIEDGASAEEIAAQRAENERAVLEQARAEHPDLKPQIVKLHQGAVFQLYLYEIWDDVRLVCSPHLQIAHFGGDLDNFTYPRYCIDFSFCRAWKDGAPADTSAHYFRWGDGPKEGELVFVTGNPGSTDRLATVAQLEYMRDVYYPIVLELIDQRLAALRELAAASPEQEVKLRTSILGLENAQKAYRGYYAALLDEELMRRKAAAEAEFYARVHADPELIAEFGDVWRQLEEIALLKAVFEPRRRFWSPGGSDPLAAALEIVRAARSRGEERVRHLERALQVNVEMSAVERALFLDHLERAGAWLPDYDPYAQAFLDMAPERVAALLAESVVGDEAVVRELVEGGMAAIRASDDPAIELARVLEPLLRAKDRQAEWLADQAAVAEVRIGQALYAVYGRHVSPDATFTLRFSDGIVAGFPFNGTLAPYRTSFFSLYGRHYAFGGEPPFDLPQAWLAVEPHLDLAKAVDFVSTNDIIGGNSGSPVVNRELEVVGLVFDGNIEMLGNRFLYTDDVPRSVSVHVDAIMVALQKVYSADRIVAELLGQKEPGSQ